MHILQLVTHFISGYFRSGLSHLTHPSHSLSLSGFRPRSIVYIKLWNGFCCSCLECLHALHLCIHVLCCFTWCQISCFPLFVSVSGLTILNERTAQCQSALGKLQRGRKAKPSMRLSTCLIHTKERALKHKSLLVSSADCHPQL